MTHLPQLERDLAMVADRLAAEAAAAIHETKAQAPRPPIGAGRRRLVRPLAFASGLAAAATVVVLAIGAGGPERLDVVAEARAAFQPHDGILHTVLIERSKSYDAKGRRVDETPNVQRSTRVEQWLMTDPPRWRAVFTRTPKSTPAAQRLARAGEFRPLEIAYGGGVSSSWDHRSRTARITSGFSDKGEAAKPIGFGSAQLRSVDDVRRLLANGRLRNAGLVQLDGRPVRKLEQTGGRDEQGRITDLMVDPETSAPVRITSSWKPFLGQKGKAPEMADLETRTVVDFQTYERLLDTPEHRRLLQFEPPASVRRWTRTLEQVQAEQRARDRARELRQARAERR